MFLNLYTHIIIEVHIDSGHAKQVYVHARAIHINFYRNYNN